MIIDVSGGSESHRSDGGYAISNISLRWMIREIVAAGHHDLFRDDNRSQEFYPRITVPAPSLLTQQSHPMTGVQGEPSDPLDIDDFNEGMEK
jgi:hypothetical protein